MKVSAILLLMGALATGAYAQRPRTMEKSTDNKGRLATAPQSVKAKYEVVYLAITRPWRAC